MRCFCAFVMTTAASLSAAPALGDVSSVSPPDRRWSGSNALTLPRGRSELGLLGGARYGLTDSLELAVNPLVAVVVPHLEAKVMVARELGFFALRGRASYPTTFLEVVSKEGEFGLL
ncbi:MAG TPA: hypothetical protein VFZ53_14520, partial [Polyangiaceae bacterium]